MLIQSILVSIWAFMNGRVFNEYFCWIIRGAPLVTGTITGILMLSLIHILHYAPCTAEGESGFRCVVVLPAGTNTDLTFPAGEDGEERLITAKNKWLIAHEEAGIDGAFCGLKGENIEI